MGDTTNEPTEQQKAMAKALRDLADKVEENAIRTAVAVAITTDGYDVKLLHVQKGSSTLEVLGTVPYIEEMIREARRG